jgi:hypothetical protein
MMSDLGPMAPDGVSTGDASVYGPPVSAHLFCPRGGNGVVYGYSENSYAHLSGCVRGVIYRPLWGESDVSSLTDRPPGSVTLTDFRPPDTQHHPRRIAERAAWVDRKHTDRGAQGCGPSLAKDTAWARTPLPPNVVELQMDVDRSGAYPQAYPHAG